MKLTIERSALLKTLGHVQSVVERRNTIPILSNVMLTADGGRLRLTATDLDIQIVDSTDAIIDIPGDTTVPAQTLMDIVRKLPEGSQVQLEKQSDGRLRVVAGRSRFQMPVLPSDDFPNISRGQMEHSFTLPINSLREALERTRFAMSTEETRYYLNGIFMHVVSSDDAPGGELIVAATDGHRLARSKVNSGEAAIAGMPDVIIPRKAVGEVMKLMSEYDGEVEISVSKTKIGFDIGHLSLTTKAIDGTFPDYSRVIPQGNKILVKANVKELAEVVDRVTVIATEKTRAVRMRVEDAAIKLSVTSPESGTSAEELACEENGSIDIGFNARYLTEMLKYIGSEEVELRFGDSASPVLITDLNRPEDKNVIMPMRV